MSFVELKEAAIQAVLALENRGLVTRDDHFQAVLDALAADIRSMHRKRMQRQIDIATMTATVVNLKAKKAYLDEQVWTMPFRIEVTVLIVYSVGSVA